MGGSYCLPSGDTCPRLPTDTIKSPSFKAVDHSHLQAFKRNSNHVQNLKSVNIIGY